MWFAGLASAPVVPTAVNEPLWHVLHAVAVTTVWFIVAGLNTTVVWHGSHEAVVGMCVAFLPVAVVPLWHVAHVPATTPV